MGSLIKIFITISIFVLLIFTGNSLNANCNSVLDKNKVSIKGRIINIEGNNLPKIVNNLNNHSPKKKDPFPKKLIVLEGKIRNKNNSPYIPISSLNSEYHIISTNSKGEFKTRLPKGTYTFFILEKNNAYLNRFDGNGFFKSIKVNSYDINLTLYKYNNATF